HPNEVQRAQRERDRPRHEAEHDQDCRRKRDQLDDALVREACGVAGFRVAEHLLHAVPQQQEAEDDPRDALQVRRQGSHRRYLMNAFLYSNASVADGIISIRSVSGGISRMASLFRATHGIMYVLGSSIVSVSSITFWLVRW